MSGVVVDPADVTYEPQTFDPSSGVVTAGQYMTINARAATKNPDEMVADPGYPVGALVQWSNPANAVDGAIAANGSFVLYEGARADYVAIVVEA